MRRTRVRITIGLRRRCSWFAHASIVHHRRQHAPTDRDANGSYETTEHVDVFTLDNTDASASTTPTHDAAGNLTFDGEKQYTCDAWNRLVKTEKAYDAPGVGVQTGSTVATYEYDGMHRRIVKDVQNSGDLDAEYHFYCDGASIVEIRNASDDVLKHYVWGVTYIDELVQVGINDDPTDGGEDDVETLYYVCHNASFNVQLLLNSDGTVQERYEYSPYGQRIVYFSPGTDDPDAYAPTLMSRRVVISTVEQPYGLCDIGFQGLFHDDETENVYNRARYWHPRLGRFIGRDPIGYPDGMNSYAGYHVLEGLLDPYGLSPELAPETWKQLGDEQMAKARELERQLLKRICRNPIPDECECCNRLRKRMKAHLDLARHYHNLNP